MKKQSRALLCTLAVLLVVALVLTSVACSQNLSSSGLSAYEIAVKNGFKGTETEWLQSLSNGKSAYDIAVENGFEGTQEQWLNSLKGSNGTNGTDGKDAAITISDLFEEYKATYKQQYNTEYTGTYIDFMKEYFAQTYDSISTQTMVADAVLSCVSVYSSFEVTTTVYDWFGRSQGSQTQTTTSGGAGVIYWLDKTAGDAYIITNFHVVYNASADQNISQDIYVLLYGYEKVYTDDLQPVYKIPATYIGGSMQKDVAVLYVHDSELLRTSNAKAAEIADSNDISIGEDAIAIGNPEGGGISVTQGIISVDSETNTMYASDEKTLVNFRVIRIDTAVNHGNSGGGLFNAYGQLIGIVHARVFDSNVDSIAYAIPSNIATYITRGVIERFEANGNVGVYSATQCYLGVTVRATASRSFYDSDTKRVVISEDVEIVEEVASTAAAYGKLQKGDIIRKIKIGQTELDVNRVFIVVDAMLLARAGDTIEVTYERNGETATCQITVTTEQEIDAK